MAGRPDSWVRERRNRLPTFTEVLSRRTRPPVDLFVFYLFLQREGAVDVIDFWLDIQQHENLCRAYFEGVLKSGRTIEQDWPQYCDYARTQGTIYRSVVGKQIPEQNTDIVEEEAEGLRTDPQPRTRTRITANPTLDTSATVEGTSQSLPSITRASTLPQRPVTTLFRARHAFDTPTAVRHSSIVNRLDLIASAERIFYRYISPRVVNSKNNHEIYLPPSLHIPAFPLTSSREPRTEEELTFMAQIPDLFHAHKKYVFQAMEQDAFPRFLRFSSFSNLTPISSSVRRILGVLFLLIGLALAFSLVFLDVQPKSKRFFLFIPFSLGILFLFSNLYKLDPILVFLGQFEVTPFRTLRVREPYVKKLLLGRAIWVSFVVAVCTVAMTLTFWAVPGYRRR